MTITRYQVRRSVQGRLDEKPNILPRAIGKMGDGNGNLWADESKTIVYIRFGDTAAVPVFNTRVFAENEIQVFVGYSQEDPGLYQVLSTCSAQPGGPAGGILPSTNHARRHEWLAPQGGQDPLYVHKRAFTDLAIYVTKPNSMSVRLMRGAIFNIDKTPIEIEDTTSDHTAYIPATPGKALLVLHTIDNDGVNVETVGDEVDLVDLMPEGDRFINFPPIPAGTIIVRGLVRVYYGQTSIQEGRTNRDIIDLRLIFNGGIAGAVEWGDILNKPDYLNKALEPVTTVTSKEFEHIFIDGTLAVLSDVYEIVISRYMTLDVSRIACRNNGSSGSTIIDLDLNGVTVYTDQSKRPTLGNADTSAVSGVPDVIDLVPGNVLSLHIDQVAVGAEGLSVTINERIQDLVWSDDEIVMDRVEMS